MGVQIKLLGSIGESLNAIGVVLEVKVLVLVSNQHSPGSEVLIDFLLGIARVVFIIIIISLCRVDTLVDLYLQILDAVCQLIPI